MQWKQRSFGNGTDYSHNECMLTMRETFLNPRLVIRLTSGDWSARRARSLPDGTGFRLF
jgi:hypothetical protein